MRSFPGFPVGSVISVIIGWPGFAPTFMDQVHPPTVVASMQVMPKKHFFAILSSAVLWLNPKRYQNTMHVWGYHGAVAAP